MVGSSLAIKGDSRSMTQFRSYYWKIWYDRMWTTQSLGAPFKSPGPESRPETPNRVNTEDLVWISGSRSRVSVLGLRG